MNLEMTKEELVELYVNQNKTDAEIALLCGCDGWKISRLRTKLGIPGINARQREFLKRPPQTPLSPRQWSIILGTLLGDGCLQPSGPRSYLSISHSKKQSDYLMWILEELKTICPNPLRPEVHHEKYEMLVLSSETRDDLAVLRAKVYTPAKTLANGIFDNIDALSLAVWFMDDGSLNYINKSRSKYSFATNGYCQEDVYRLKQILLAKFEIESEVKPISRTNGKTQFVLVISDSCFEKFARIVSPYIVPSMKYKLHFEQQAQVFPEERAAIEDMYCNQNMTQAQIARSLGLGIDAIRRRMDSIGISMRSNSEAQLEGKNSRLERASDGTFAGIKWGEEEEQLVESMFVQLRESGIDPEPIDLPHQVGIIDHIANLKAECFKEEQGFRYCRTGMNLCTTLCSHTLDMASIGSLPPRQIFLDDQMLRDCIARTIRYAKRTTPSAVKHGLKTYRSNRSVTFFPPAWCKFVIDSEFTNCDHLNMLDFSAGFGGRMLGAYASGRIGKYVGVDPLAANILSLNEMQVAINEHARLSSREFCVDLRCATAEDALTGMTSEFDVVLTSPPYFNKEHYADDETQCYIRFPHYEEWVNEWLEPTIRKAVNLLKDGGKIIIFAGNWGKYAVGEDCRNVLAAVTGDSVRQAHFFLPSIEYLRNNGPKRFETAWIATKRVLN